MRAEAAEKIGKRLDHALAHAFDPVARVLTPHLRLRRQQAGRHRDQHEQRHGPVHRGPRHVVGQHQRQRARHDQRNAVAQRVSGHQRALRFRRRDFDAVSVHRNIQGGAGKCHQQGQADEQRKLRRRRCHRRHCQQAGHHCQLRQQQPAAALPQAPQQRQPQAVDQRRPQKLEGVGQPGAGNHGDVAQRDAVFLEPVGQRAGHQQERQAGSEAEEKQRQRGRLQKSVAHAQLGLAAALADRRRAGRGRIRVVRAVVARFLAVLDGAGILAHVGDLVGWI